MLIASCSGKPYVVKPSQDQSSVRPNKIFVLSHGWHTGLILSADQMNHDLPMLKKRFGDTLYYEFGWGDKGFYQAKKITTGLTLQAMFWSTGAVVHVVSVENSPYDYFPGSEITEICLGNSEFASLKKFISDSFYHDGHGNIVALTLGIYGDSQFYEGEGKYHIFNTCNKWTAKALKSAGMEIPYTFKLTAGSVMNYLKTASRQ